MDTSSIPGGANFKEARWDNSATGFRSWLVGEGYSQSTIRRYLSSMEIVEQYLADNDVEFHFYGNGDVKAIEGMANYLIKDEDFKEANATQFSSLRTTLKKFTNYATCHGKKRKTAKAAARAAKAAQQKAEAPAKVVRDDYENSVDGFKQWMADTGLSKVTVKIYASTIVRIDQYLESIGSDARFYGNTDVDELNNTMGMLLADRNFVEDSIKTQSHLRSVMRKYIAFVEHCNK